MKITCIVLVSLFLSLSHSYSQSCLPDGLEINQASDLTTFLEEYPDCKCILGDLTIKGTYSISKSLEGLEQINKVQGNVSLESINHNDEQLDYLDSII